MLPAEGGLRRIIGDGESRPDGEVEGLGPEQLLALFRDLVLLRTYDERSVIYHRQGRIGAYAIFWNHEAMQAGSVFALEARDWVFPSYRDSAIGLLRGMPASTVLSWWRGHPAGWWNRRTTTSPRSASPSRRRYRTPSGSPGLAVEERRPGRDRQLRRRRDLGDRFTEVPMPA